MIVSLIGIKTTRASHEILELKKSNNIPFGAFFIVCYFATKSQVYFVIKPFVCLSIRAQ